MAHLKDLIVNGPVRATSKVYSPEFVGDLTGTATKATQDADGNVIDETYLPLKGGKMSGNLEFSNSGTTTRGVIGTVGGNDYWRIVGGATADNDAYLEIATADDGSEPIYVRQYSKGKFETLARTATLLDGSGNTKFPGKVTASSFAGALTGNVTGNVSGSSGSCTGNSATATALTTSAGSATQPVYFSSGKPVACTYTLGKSVPSNAVFTDTVYTHPTSSGNKHIPSGGSSGQILRWSADGTAVWGNDNNTTYSNFVKSGSGAKAGLVPAPSTTAGTTKYLREDGTWAVPPDNNTKVIQTVTTSNASYPLLLAPSGQTVTAATTSYFDSGVTLNPSTNTIVANISGSSASCTGNSATATKATQDASGNVITDTYALKSLYSNTNINVGRLSGSTAGARSTAEGYNTTASGTQSHAEGYYTTASGTQSHAEGYNTTASGNYSHAEGYNTTASSDESHAEGYSTIASGADSHAEGSSTTASGMDSHAEGYSTIALNYQHAQGHFNNTSLAKAYWWSGTSTGTAFVIGNGTSTAASNAFRITGEGITYAKGAYNTSGADYAEFAEWADGNTDNEDRRGYFVTFDEEKTNMIRKANEGDYILGIVSGNPCIIGNSDEGWLGQYVFDEFGAHVYEEVEEQIEYVDEETGEIKTKTELVTTYKLNPDYDPERGYIHRKDRPEWDYVGWMGVLSVRDDSTCVPGGYCKVADGGIATGCERGIDTYRVLERVNDNIVKVALK